MRALGRKPSIKIITLGFVWGTNAQRLILTEANIARLRTPGSLQLERLPQTIVDAVNVVQMLGERYLSVDALCIIQDDEDDFEARIPATGLALLTIVAGASIDVKSRLPGVRPGSRSL